MCGEGSLLAPPHELQDPPVLGLCSSNPCQENGDQNKTHLSGLGVKINESEMAKQGLDATPAPAFLSAPCWSDTPILLVLGMGEGGAG